MNGIWRLQVNLFTNFPSARLKKNLKSRIEKEDADTSYVVTQPRAKMFDPVRDV